MSVDKNALPKAEINFRYASAHMPGELSAQFLADNPPFGVRPLKCQQMNARLPNNDLIPEKLYEAEQTKQQINRYCRQLQALLFLLPEFPDAEVSDEVVDHYLKATGDLIYMLFHLSDVCGESLSRADHENKSIRPGHMDRQGGENEQ